jgi:hypothetical protein
LSALLDARKVSTKASLLGILDILDDGEEARLVPDSETGELLDEEILEEHRATFVEIAFEEIGYRSETVGKSYPFELDVHGGKVTCTIDEKLEHAGQLVYVFCLLASALREGRLTLPASRSDKVKREIAQPFQICACLAAGGFFNGAVSSFGFPRATGDGFLPALRNAYSRVRLGKVVSRVPPGLPEKLKDAGIDVIAWRDHPDRLPGKLYLLGQCASGCDWRDKSVLAYTNSLHASWFAPPPATHFTPAMFIPFPIEHEVNESKEVEYREVLHNSCLYDERSFGIIFDRGRMAHYAKQGMDLPPDQRKEIDGSDLLDQVRDWILSAFGGPIESGVTA